MNPSLASLIYACGIAGLFFLNRDNTVHTSKALWLPVAWLWIMGSRPVSFWLGVSPAPGTNVQLDGSPVDALVFGVLMTAAIIVLIRRGSQTRTFLTVNGPILLYFFYCLISLLWAPYPDVGFKRWIKDIGDLAMVLLLVTEVDPAAALGRLFSRVGFVLFPTSVLFIKYYGELGRGYGPGGEPMNTGVTTNKNVLGLILLVVSLGTVWRILGLLQDKTLPSRGRHLFAQLTLLSFEIALFQMADSATSLACFVLGTTIIVATKLSVIRRHPSRVHALVAMIALAGACSLLFAGEGVTHALGRQSNLSGRTDIWAAVIPALSKPIIGDGYESFWISSDVVKVWQSPILSGWWDVKNLNEAHNGYIEIYLNLGWVGVGLISFILITGYRRAVAAFRLNQHIGGLMLAYLIAAVVYNITEAGFRMLDPIWIFLKLAIVSASSIVAFGYIGLRPSEVVNAATGEARVAVEREFPAAQAPTRRI